MDSPEWHKHHEAHGPNMLHILKELSAAGLAGRIQVGNGQAYRIDRQGYRELTRSLAEIPRDVFTGPSSPRPEHGAQGGGTNKPRRARSRQEMMDDLVGPSGAPPAGAPSVDRSLGGFFARQEAAAFGRENLRPSPSSPARRESEHANGSPRQASDRPFRDWNR